MVWFILAAIILYLALCFATWGEREDFSIQIDRSDVSDILKTSLLMWIGIVSIILLVLFIVLGIIACFPVVER